LSQGIFLIQNDGQLVEMREQPYDSEALLQRLLADYPNLLAGDQINTNEPRRWLLVTREAGLPSTADGNGRWAVDHLFLDQDAVPTIVEVKRSTDTRIRREVVGQMLDYAANAIVYWPVESIQRRFEARCQLQDIDADQTLAQFLDDALDAEAFWQQVQANLQAGKVRLIFVADEIPVELRRVVEFLNAQMSPAEVLAVEIKQFTSTELRTLVPRVVGLTAEAQQRKGVVTRSPKQWDEQRFFQDLQQRQLDVETRIARQILAWAQRTTTRIWWGKGQRSGSFYPMLNHRGVEHWTFAVWSSGYVEVSFQYYRTKPPFDDEAKRRDLLKRLNAAANIAIPEDAIRRRPSFPLAALGDEQRLSRFLDVFSWYIQQIQTT